MITSIKRRLFLIKEKWLLKGGKSNRTLLFPRAEVKRALPVNLNGSDTPLFESEYSKTLNEAAIYDLQKAVITYEGVVYCNNNLIPESAQGKLRKDFYEHVLWARKTKQTNSIGPYLIVFNKWSMAYYHWLAEVLPKLIWFSANNNIEQYTLLLPDSHRQNFILDYLNKLGYNKVVYFNADENIRLENAKYISEFSQTGNIRPEVAADIRSYYSNTENAGKMVYISRAKSPKRKVVNEEQLLRLLTGFGVEVVYTDNMPVEEQIDIFSKCKLLIAIHGAGLTNMLFMPTGGKIIELRLHGDNTNNCYFSLASALGLPYYYSLCESSDTSKSTQEADFVANIEDITRTLKEISGSTIT